MTSTVRRAGRQRSSRSAGPCGAAFAGVVAWGLACNSLLGIEKARFEELPGPEAGTGGADVGAPGGAAGAAMPMLPSDPAAPNGTVDVPAADAGAEAGGADADAAGEEPLPPGSCPGAPAACSEDGLGVVQCVESSLVLVPCAAGERCDPGLASGAGCRTLEAPECAAAPGEVICVGSTRVSCGATALDAPSLVQCASEQHCRQGAGAACAECVASEPPRCDGARLSVCRDNRWDVSTCGSSELCNASAGRCNVCSPGGAQCSSDGTLSVCNADGTELARTVSCGRGLCDAGRARCNACVANTLTCEDGERVRCGADGQTLAPEPCPLIAPVCAGAGSCVDCVVDDDCRLPGLVCSADRRCVECVTASDCGAGLPICSPEGDCVQCLTDSDCDDGACVVGLCQ